MDSNLKDNLRMAVNARQVLTRKDIGTSDVGPPDPALIAAYRNVFVNHPEGNIVLADLMSMMKFSEKGSDNYHLAMRNLALEILTRCGIQGDDLIRAVLNGL